jgi:hypothetical protein
LSAQRDRRLERGIRELRDFIRDAGGGRIGTPRVEDRTVTVPLQGRDGELYYLEMRIGRYLDEPPSCHFTDEQGERTPRAWPEYDSRGPFRPPLFICTPPTAEFYRYHSERSYQPSEGTLACAVGTIYAALQSPFYRGRFCGERLRRRRPGRRPL